MSFLQKGSGSKRKKKNEKSASKSILQKSKRRQAKIDSNSSINRSENGRSPGLKNGRSPGFNNQPEPIVIPKSSPKTSTNVTKSLGLKSKPEQIVIKKTSPKAFKKAICSDSEKPVTVKNQASAKSKCPLNNSSLKSSASKSPKSVSKSSAVPSSPTSVSTPGMCATQIEFG